MQALKSSSIFLLMGCFLGGCIVGDGFGWVTGTVKIDNCVDGESLIKEGDYDLEADFFAGEPLPDSTETLSQQRNGLNLRIQNTSNNTEDSDGMLFQFSDVRAAARIMATGQPIPITSNGLCDQSCSGATDLLRSRLYIFASCPDCQQQMLGTSREMVQTGEDAGCFLPTGVIGPECPTLSAADQQALNEICGSDFSLRTFEAKIEEILGGGACLYLCRFGSLSAGKPAGNLDEFTIEFNDHIEALFSMSVVDARSIDRQICAGAAGQVRGMFSFEIVRGSAAQSFP